MAAEQAIRLLEQVVRDIPVGTNLALFYLFYGLSSAAPSCKAEGLSFPLSSLSA